LQKDISDKEICDIYDLNRDEATVLILIDDPKWINDYAVCKVIRTLKKRIDELEKLNPCDNCGGITFP
jgi:hypothetical protein